MNERVRKMEDHLKNAENEREKLAQDLNKRIEECNALRTKLRNEETRRETFEEKLLVSSPILE